MGGCHFSAIGWLITVTHRLNYHRTIGTVAFIDELSSYEEDEDSSTVQYDLYQVILPSIRFLVKNLEIPKHQDTSLELSSDQLLLGSKKC